MNKGFRVAILGAGSIAADMAKALNGLKDEVELYAIASRSIEKAEAFKEKWGVKKAYGSYEELAEDDNVDLIYIATPHSEHFANTKLCMEKGRNCLVEKAFCANAKQTKELVSIASKNNVFMAEAMWTRYQPSRDVIASLLTEGAIGEVHALEADFSVPIHGVERLVNPALCGGALLDLGVYALTTPVMYLGADVTKISIESVITDTGVDATDIIKLVYPNGTMAKVKCSFVDEESNYAKIMGDKGYLTFAPINAPTCVKVFDPEGNLLNQIDTPLMINGYEYEVLECKKQILAGEKEAVSMPLSETIRMMGWMDAIRNEIGVIYPFEEKDDIDGLEEEFFGVKDLFDHEDPWDRSNTTSYLEIYDIKTGSREVVLTYDGVIEAPNWSHDGSFLTYNGNGLVYTFDLATRESKQIDSGKLNMINNDHVLSSDDQWISVSDESDETGKSRIYRIPLAGGAPIPVTENVPSYLHGWGIDDQYMCYCAERNGEYDIYEICLDGSKEVRLTSAPGLNDGSEYDSTGEYIYFNSVRCGLMQAYRMKRDGSEQTKLTSDNHLNTWFPHISPDGKKVVAISYYKGDLWPGDHVPNKMVELRLMEPDGSNAKTIMKIFGGQGTINVNSWSPDSEKFAFVSYKKNK